MTEDRIGPAGVARRREAVQLALRLEDITIAWMTVEAVGAIAAGLLARSTLLLAVGMPVLARAKLPVAHEIGSRALRADAMESFTGECACGAES